MLGFELMRLKLRFGPDGLPPMMKGQRAGVGKLTIGPPREGHHKRRPASYGTGRAKIDWNDFTLSDVGPRMFDRFANTRETDVRS